MARRQLSVNEKIWIIKHMYRLEYPINVQRLWCNEINSNPPHRDTIRVLMNKFEQTGSVLNIDSPGRPISVTDQSTKDQVLSILKKNSSNVNSSNEFRIEYFEIFTSAYV